MQYCPSCKVQIRGRKARCPLCQRELMTAVSIRKASAAKGAGAAENARVRESGYTVEDAREPENDYTSEDARVRESGYTSEDVRASEAGYTAEDAREPEIDYTSEIDYMSEDACAPEIDNTSEDACASEIDYTSENACVPEIDYAVDDDPFVCLPRPKVSFMLMMRAAAFFCISLEIAFGAVQIITGFKHGWLFAAMLAVPVVWADIMVTAYYRSNLIRMLTTEAYLVMAACLVLQNLTHTGSWAVVWAVPALFCLLIGGTFAAAKAQGMELQEFILYPAFDVLCCLLQIIPIAMGWNTNIAPAVICIACMLILVSGLAIFRGRMLRDAAYKYLHM